MILFLDDDPTRTKHFRVKVPWAETTETAAGMIEMLEGLGETQADYVFLDHDLGGETFVDSSNKNTGMEVVRWVTANKGVNVLLFIVHTFNFAAGQEMCVTLRESLHVPIYAPFDSNLFDAVVKQVVKEHESEGR